MFGGAQASEGPQAVTSKVETVERASHRIPQHEERVLDSDDVHDDAASQYDILEAQTCRDAGLRRVKG